MRCQSIQKVSTYNLLAGDVEVNREDRRIAVETLIVDSDFDLYLQRIFEGLTGEDTHLANFFVSLMEMIEVLFLYIDSIRTHNWQAYLESIRFMMPWMHIYDNNNYGRLLPVSMMS